MSRDFFKKLRAVRVQQRVAVTVLETATACDVSPTGRHMVTVVVSEANTILRLASACDAMPVETVERLGGTCCAAIVKRIREAFANPKSHYDVRAQLEGLPGQLSAVLHQTASVGGDRSYQRRPSPSRSTYGDSEREARRRIEARWATAFETILRGANVYSGLRAHRDSNGIELTLSGVPITTRRGGRWSAVDLNEGQLKLCVKNRTCGVCNKTVSGPTAHARTAAHKQIIRAEILRAGRLIDAAVPHRVFDRPVDPNEVAVRWFPRVEDMPREARIQSAYPGPGDIIPGVAWRPR